MKRTEVSLHDASGNIITGAKAQLAPNDAPERAVEMVEESSELMHAVSELPDRDRHVVQLRFGIDVPCHTQEEVAARLGVSRQRIQQIEQRALARLRLDEGLGDKNV